MGTTIKTVKEKERLYILGWLPYNFNEVCDCVTLNITDDYHNIWFVDPDYNDQNSLETAGSLHIFTEKALKSVVEILQNSSDYENFSGEEENEWDEQYMVVVDCEPGDIIASIRADYNWQYEGTDTLDQEELLNNYDISKNEYIMHSMDEHNEELDPYYSYFLILPEGSKVTKSFIDKTLKEL